MNVELHEVGDVVVLRVDGNIVGAEASSALRNTLDSLLADGKTRIVVNLASVDWINSTGLGTLVSLLISVRNRRGELKLACLSERVARLLETTRLLDVVDSYDDLQRALASYEPA